MGAARHRVPLGRTMRLGGGTGAFREAYLADSPGVGLEDLLAGCSYEEEVIPRFMQLHPEPFPEERNAFILLYNFAYRGQVRHAANERLSFNYIGSVRYE